MNMCLSVSNNLASASGPVELVCWVWGLVWNNDEILAVGPDVELLSSPSHSNWESILLLHSRWGLYFTHKSWSTCLSSQCYEAGARFSFPFCRWDTETEIKWFARGFLCWWSGIRSWTWASWYGIPYWFLRCGTKMWDVLTQEACLGAPALVRSCS